MRHHHDSGGDADADPQPTDFRHLQTVDRLQDFQCRPDRPRGLALVCHRIAEEGDDAVAHPLIEVTVIVHEAGGAGVFVQSHDGLQHFRVDPLRQFGEPDDVAEQHRELPAFALLRRSGLRRSEGLVYLQGRQQTLAWTERQAEFLQIVVGQDLQRRQIDFVAGEQVRVLFEPDARQPVRDRIDLGRWGWH